MVRAYTYHKGKFTITTDKSTFNLDVIHGYLTRSYWKRGVSKELVVQAINNAFCFGLFEQTTQIGFARVISDFTDFAYLCDVFIVESHQGHGLGTWLMESIITCPELEGIRSFTLGTRDAQAFYRKFGFQVIDQPDRWMIKLFDRPWYIPE